MTTKNDVAMMQKVDSIEKLAERINDHVDCYVSTDVGEVEAFLISSGFKYQES